MARLPVAELRIYDDIGHFGVTASSVADQLDRLGDGPLNVHINSGGGNAFEGIAIHSVLARHPGRKTVYIDSVAASAASIIAMAGDEVVVSPYGRLMIHDAAIVTAGTAREIKGVAEMVDRLSATLAQMYADRAGGDVAAWREAMLTETWYGAREAVAAGLADRVGTAPGASTRATPLAPPTTAVARTVAVAAARRSRITNLATKG